jgi:hypothetical protein
MRRPRLPRTSAEGGVGCFAIRGAGRVPNLATQLLIAYLVSDVRWGGNDCRLLGKQLKGAYYPFSLPEGLCVK